MSVSFRRSLEEIFLLRSNKVGLPNFITLLLCHMKSIVFFSSTATTIFMLLPQENVNGRPVPTFFRDRPTDYYIFLISTLFAVVGAFSALLNQHKPRVERFFGICAVASMLSALAIVLYAASLWFVGQLLQIYIGMFSFRNMVGRIYAKFQKYLSYQLAQLSFSVASLSLFVLLIVTHLLATYFLWLIRG